MDVFLQKSSAMTYKETTEWLFKQLSFYQRDGKIAYKGKLDNTLALDEALGKPHTRYKTIHIAGTNGKGSTSHLLASILMESGYRVGLYTSPHLKDFKERIVINGMPIEENYVVSFVSAHRKLLKVVNPSFFEMTVAMAFSYFEEQKVDYAVIETGLGGRLDSTNIITPVLSVITNISMDHSDILGDTVRKIAAEKAGIIKQGVPTVVGRAEDGIKDLFIEKASEMYSALYFCSASGSVQEYGEGRLISNHCIYGKW
jgi:dihydrofolate synthase / folylpolyglutamate synthase